MDRRTFVAITGGALLGLSPNLWAQGPVPARRIGLLATITRADIEAFLAQLRPELEKLGWADGRNIAFLEPRTSGSDNARLPSLASELVAQGPDLIIVQSVPATRALMQATKSIPIVMSGVANPVELGIVASFVKPGGNVTGSSFLGNEFAGKLLQLLKEAAPRLRSVALFVNPTNEAVPQFVQHMQAVAVALGLEVQVVEVSSPSEFEAAFVAIRRANTESILLPPEPLIRSKRARNRRFRAEIRIAAGRRRRQPCSSGKWSDRPRASARRVRAPSGPVRRPDLEGCQTRRFVHRTTDAVPSRDQSQSSQGARPDHPADAAASCGRED